MCEHILRENVVTMPALVLGQTLCTLFLDDFALLLLKYAVYIWTMGTIRLFYPAFMDHSYLFPAQFSNTLTGTHTYACMDLFSEEIINQVMCKYWSVITLCQSITIINQNCHSKLLRLKHCAWNSVRTHRFSSFNNWLMSHHWWVINAVTRDGSDCMLSPGYPLFFS